MNEFEHSYREFLENHELHRSGERKGRLVRGHGSTGYSPHSQRL